MKVKALKNFSGRISMSVGEERNLEDEFLIDDLLSAGYIKELAELEKSEDTGQEKPEDAEPEKPEDTGQEKPEGRKSESKRNRRKLSD